MAKDITKKDADLKINVNSHSAIIVQLIKDNNFKKIAEIGIFEARTARYALRQLRDQIDEYWGIDKYNEFFPATSYRFPRTNSKKWSDMHWRACRYMPFFNKFRLLRMESEEAANLFKHYLSFTTEDGYFDFVYIDADHTYEMVKRDINLWLPLVKKGGIIGGHDYGFPDEVVRHGGVQKAVDEIFGDNDSVLVDRPSGVWHVRKQ